MAENTLFKTALNKAMNHCSRRELCINDMQGRLLSWGIEKSDSDKIISILIEESFINESRYAAAFVRDKFRYNKWGKVKIAAHLKAKHITPGIINTALDSIDNETYKNTVKALITNHIHSVKAKNPYELKAKLLRYGLSKGFESTLLYDILNDMEE
jgi:regulatory protein